MLVDICPFKYGYLRPISEQNQLETPFALVCRKYPDQHEGCGHEHGGARAQRGRLAPRDAAMLQEDDSVSGKE
jgi:hypothetical protein